MLDALEYLSEARPNLGIPEALNLDQKPPIILQYMKRMHLAALFKELGYRTGAEIGVAYGEYSRTLTTVNPAATIYSIDPWEPYPEYLETYTVPQMEQIYEKAKKRLAGTGCVIM